MNVSNFNGRQSSNVRGGKLRSYEPLLMTLLRIVDALLGIGIFVLLIRYYGVESLYVRQFVVIVFFLSIIFFHEVGIYRSWRFSSLWHEISQIILGCFFLYSFLFVVGYFLKLPNDFTRIVVINWMILWPATMSIGRIGVRSVLRRYRKKGYNIRRAVIAGAGETGQQLAHLIIDNPWSGTELLGFFDDKVDKPVNGFPFLGKLHDLPDFARKHKLNIVYLALPMRAESKIISLLNTLSDSMVSVFFVPNILFLELMLGGSLEYFEDFPVIALQDTPIRGINALFKRLEDLTLASLILIITSPILIGIVLFLKLTSREPVFFKQERYGLNGEPIDIYKFKTMTVSEDGNNFKQVTRDDPRVTRFGAFLRRTSLDELPQFINVIQGRMSLVGPRPHPVAMNEEYRKLVPGYMLRHKVKPGITGLAQINGFRGETDTLDKMVKRIQYDLEYLRQWSLMLDIKIVVKTILSGAWKNNAY